MKDRDKQGLPKRQEELFFEDTNVVASATDCTGLMPTPPINEAEAESYTDLYAIPQVGNVVDNGLQRESGIHGDMVRKEALQHTSKTKETKKAKE